MIFPCVWILLFFPSVPLVLAQFPFFEQMFGQAPPGHQQRPPSGPGQWAAQSDSIPCSEYLCPKTLTCVPNPAQCPCPDAQDVKCIIPDAEDTEGATVVCVRGRSDCSALERLIRQYN